MGPLEALEIALDQENKAIAYYQKLCIQHKASLGDLCEFLITEEQKHRQLIENKIAQLRLG